MAKSQAATEYLMVISFVTLALIIVIFLTNFYSEITKNKISQSQLEISVNKIISSAESVYYAGEPSQVTVLVYFPKGISSMTLEGKALIIERETPFGISKIVYLSRVNLTGNIPIEEGTKKLLIKATTDKVEIS